MLYLDTSFLAPLVRGESRAAAVERYVNRASREGVAVSRLTELELRSVVAREVRMRHIAPRLASELIAELMARIDETMQIWTPEVKDFVLAGKFVMRFETRLRAPDALHLAIAENRGAKLMLTLDRGLLKAAKTLGIPASHGIQLVF